MSKMIKNALLATAGAAAAFTGAQATVSADTVTVQSGDTLSKIATEHNTTVDALAKTNNISQSDLIVAGSTINISTDQNVKGLSADKATYTVQSGDTLTKIAEKTGVSAQILAQNNDISNTDLVVTDAVLKLSTAQTTATVETKTVAQTVPANVEYIAAADANHDNYMTAAEYTTYQANGGSAQQATEAKPTQTATTSTETVPANVEYVAAADANHDNYMTASEYLAYKANGGSAQQTTTEAKPTQTATTSTETVSANVEYVAAADANHDNYMTAAEYSAYKANGGSAQQTTQAATQQAQTTQTKSSAQLVQTSNETTSNTSSVATSSADATINAWNAMRAKMGLKPVTISASLSAHAQQRAQLMGSSSNWFGAHVSSNTPEVVANGFGAGSSVINAWYYETGMVNGGHTEFIVNPNFTQAGVGYYNGWIVVNAQ